MRANVEKTLIQKLLCAESATASTLHAWVEILDALGWRIALNLAEQEWLLSEQAKADMASWDAENPGAFRDADRIERFWLQLDPARRFAESAQVRIWLPREAQPGAENPQNPNALASASPELTRREREVWHWLREGKTGPEVALILGCAPRTVESHVARLYRKLGVHNRTELLGLAKTRAECVP